MSDMPESIEQLFSDDKPMYCCTSKVPMDNNQSMDYFLELIGCNFMDYVSDEGTQVVLQHPDFNYQVQIDAGGLGDSFSHKFDIKRL